MMRAGTCDNPGCRFAHKRSEIRRRKQSTAKDAQVMDHFLELEPAVEHTPPMPTAAVCLPAPRQPVKPFRSVDSVETESSEPAQMSSLKLLSVKTKMCKFHLVGQCCKGEACTYAHNPEELRPMPDLSLTPQPCVPMMLTPPLLDVEEVLPITARSSTSSLQTMMMGPLMVQEAHAPRGLSIQRDTEAPWYEVDGMPKFQVLCL